MRRDLLVAGGPSFSEKAGRGPEAQEGHLLENTVLQNNRVKPTEPQKGVYKWKLRGVCSKLDWVIHL